MPTSPAPSSALSAPALWRPSAIALWSLLFTPVFGSWLLMHNWRVLGQQAAARSARRWLLASVAVLVLQLLTSATIARLNGNAPLAEWMALAWFGLWLLAAAAPQWRLVRHRLGRDYARRGWNGVVACALAWAGGYALGAALLAGLLALT